MGILISRWSPFSFFQNSIGNRFFLRSKSNDMSALLFAKRQIIYSKKYHSTVIDLLCEWTKPLLSFTPHGAIKTDSNSSTNTANEMKSSTWIQRYANYGQNRGLKKQGRIHGNPVADGWAGAVMQKPLGIQKCDGRTDGRTDRPTRQGVESRVRATKKSFKQR